MKKVLLTALALMGIIGSVSAQQYDDLYFIPKKKKAKTEIDDNVNLNKEREGTVDGTGYSSVSIASSATASPAQGIAMDEDTYNRRGTYLTDAGESVSEFAMNGEGFTVITEEGDTTFVASDTLRLTRVGDADGWVNGFDGSDSDYEYAMRIVRFRNPRYAIPVSSPLYWDVVYGGALWPSWNWNVYDDGMYAYVFPTSSNWMYWDYMMGYPYGWSPWGSHWNSHWGWNSWHYGYHYGPHLSFHFGWYDPWLHPGWHHAPHYGHHHPAHYPGWGGGTPGWRGTRVYRNERKAIAASSRPNSRESDVRNSGNAGTRNSSTGRVVTGRAGATGRTVSGMQRTTNGDDVVRRSASSSTVNRRATSGSSSRSSYNRQSSSRSGSSNSVYSGTSRSSSSNRSSSSYNSSSTRSSRSGSYSTGSTSRSGSFSSGGGSSRSSAGTYSGGSRSTGSRR